MSAVKVKATVTEGLIPSERIALVKTTDGLEEEVTLPVTQAWADQIRAWVIEEAEGRFLIELPRETSSGSWRLWVDSQLVSQEAVSSP